MRASNPDESCPLGMWLLLAAFVLLHAVLAVVALRCLPDAEVTHTTSGEVGR